MPALAEGFAIPRAYLWSATAYAEYEMMLELRLQGHHQRGCRHQIPTSQCSSIASSRRRCSPRYVILSSFG